MNIELLNIKKDNKKSTAEKLPPLEILKKEKDNSFRKLLEEYQTEKNKKKDEIPLGFNKEGTISSLDLNNNVLILGTTGGGKSICLNEIISSIIMNYKKEEIKILTIDTSLIELSTFNGIPHYLKNTLIHPEQIVKELKLLKEHLEKDNNPQNTFIVIIDDLYDVCTYDKNIFQILLDLLEESKNKNISFILATDTPIESTFKEKLREKIQSVIYLTLSPGTEKDFFLDKKLTQEEMEFLAKIGNAVYEKNNKKEEIIIPEIKEEEINKIKEFYNSIPTGQ